MTRCPEIDFDSTDRQCSQEVEDHRITVGEYGLMLRHTLAEDKTGCMDWFTGPGYDRYMEAQRAQRSS